MGPSTAAVHLPPVAAEMLYTAMCAVDVSSSAKLGVLEEDSRCTTASAGGAIGSWDSAAGKGGFAVEDGAGQAGEGRQLSISGGVQRSQA